MPPERPCEDTVRKQEERPPHKTELILDFLASTTVRNKFLLCKTPSVWYFVVAAQANRPSGADAGGPYTAF